MSLEDRIFRLESFPVPPNVLRATISATQAIAAYPAGFVAGTVTILGARPGMTVVINPTNAAAAALAVTSSVSAYVDVNDRVTYLINNVTSATLASATMTFAVAVF